MKVTLDIPDDFDKSGKFAITGNIEDRKAMTCEKINPLDKIYFTTKGRKNVESYKDSLKRKALHDMCDFIWLALVTQDAH